MVISSVTPTSAFHVSPVTLIVIINQSVSLIIIIIIIVTVLYSINWRHSLKHVNLLGHLNLIKVIMRALNLCINLCKVIIVSMN